MSKRIMEKRNHPNTIVNVDMLYSRPVGHPELKAGRPRACCLYRFLGTYMLEMTPFSGNQKLLVADHFPVLRILFPNRPILTAPY